MAELDRIKRNVAKMVSMNAPESDIDSYISSEGTTIDAVRNYKPQTAQPKQQGYISPLKTFGMELSSGVPAGGKITSALGAGIAKLGGAEQPIGELYQQAQEYQQESREQNPKSALAGSLTGSLATAPLVPKAVTSALGSGGLGARVAKGALAGAGTGALYGAGEAEDIAEGAKSGAIFGGVTGGVIPAVSAGVKGLFQNVKPTFTADKLRKLSSGKYQSLGEAGEVITPEMTSDLFKEIDKVAPKPIKGLVLPSEDKEVINAINEFSELAGSSMNLDDANRLYKALGEKINRTIGLQGRPNSTGVTLLKIQDKISDMIDNAPSNKAWNEAKELWKAAKKTEDIERIIERAEMRDNAATAIKSGFRTLMQNPKRLKGYSPSEIQMIQKIAKGEPITDTLRTVLGSRLLSTLIGSTQGLGGAAIGTASSVASRGAAERILLKKAMQLLNEIQTPAVNMTLGKLKKAPPSRLTEVLTIVGSGQAGR